MRRSDYNDHKNNDDYDGGIGDDDDEAKMNMMMNTMIRGD